jgi:NAD(P)-dependent dehydrogenase (short-subunit alcohol dehydrogenase family)
MPRTARAVLITGCSTGIGRATAERLARRDGWTVYATARRLESIEDLRPRGCTTLALDVTKEESMRAAVEQVEQDAGAVWALINNAGYSQSGALESLPMEQLRTQFETNVFGLVRLCQLVLPKMREQRDGRILNLSSMGGRLTFPGGGAYHATKYAVEALSDALRFEVSGFGIQVVLIEPGLIRTQFGEAAVGSMGEIEDEGPYGTFNAAVAATTAGVYGGPLARLGARPDAVAKTIETALTKSRPKARYPVTASARLMLGLRRVLPDRGWDTLVGGTFPRPGR